MSTDELIVHTGHYMCKTCGEEGVAVEVYLIAGDAAPSCLRHRTVAWVMV